MPFGTELSASGVDEWMIRTLKGALRSVWHLEGVRLFAGTCRGVVEDVYDHVPPAPAKGPIVLDETATRQDSLLNEPGFTGHGSRCVVVYVGLEPDPSQPPPLEPH